jgi:MFS-type transporter involved in bile tolerance (Atg22 family)
VQRRELWAWAGFDFANSGYTTVVITAFFSAYFVGVVAGDAGCHSCHSTRSCTERCPKQIDPSGAIAGLKRTLFWESQFGGTRHG